MIKKTIKKVVLSVRKQEKHETKINLTDELGWVDWMSEQGQKKGIINLQELLSATEERKLWRVFILKGHGT